MDQSAGRAADGNCVNFLAQFRDPATLGFKRVTSADFLACWKHYDKDNSGYLEGQELDGFLHEFIASVNTNADAAVGAQALSPAAMEELMKDIMLAYDEDEDGRISVAELAQILPTDETFLVLFSRDNPVSSSVEFIRVWRAYDPENRGFIESGQLSEFLASLLEKVNRRVDEHQLKEYTQTILRLFDANGDGRLQLSEMARLLPVRENYLRRPLFKSASRLTSREIERIFHKYDSDGNGMLENEELDGFLKDLLEAVGDDVDETKLQNLRSAVLAQWDVDDDGKLGKEELSTLLIHSSRMAQEAEVLWRGVLDEEKTEKIE